MVDSKDALNIKIPLIMLASKDEDVEEVKKFEANLTADKHVETFKDQIHGYVFSSSYGVSRCWYFGNRFMAARSDLENERVKSEYERGYKTVLEFFGKHLK